MYNFALKKDMNKMLDEFEHLCSSVKEIHLYATESKLEKYDCKSELGIVVYYLDSKAVAYLDDENTLYILKCVDGNKTLEIVEEITHELNERVYLEFDYNADCFAKDINRIMYRKQSYIKAKEFDTEADDNKVWQAELAKQANACNNGRV